MARTRKSVEEIQKSIIDAVYTYGGMVMEADNDDDEAKNKSSLSATLSRAVKFGVIKKHHVCSICHSRKNVKFHHPAYSSPFVVVELCHKHHTQRHADKFCLLDDKSYLEGTDGCILSPRQRQRRRNMFRNIADWDTPRKSKKGKKQPRRTRKAA